MEQAFEFEGEQLFAGEALVSQLEQGLLTASLLAGRRTLVQDPQASKLKLRRAILRVASSSLPPLRLSKPKAVHQLGNFPLGVIGAGCDLLYKGWQPRLTWAARSDFTRRKPIAKIVSRSTLRFQLRADERHRRCLPILIGAEIQAVQSHLDEQEKEFEKFKDGFEARVNDLADILHRMFALNPNTFKTSQALYDENAAKLRAAALNLAKQA